MNSGESVQLNQDIAYENFEADTGSATLLNSLDENEIGIQINKEILDASITATLSISSNTIEENVIPQASPLDLSTKRNPRSSQENVYEQAENNSISAALPLSNIPIEIDIQTNKGMDPLTTSALPYNYQKSSKIIENSLIASSSPPLDLSMKSNLQLTQENVHSLSLPITKSHNDLKLSATADNMNSPSSSSTYYSLDDVTTQPALVSMNSGVADNDIDMNSAESPTLKKSLIDAQTNEDSETIEKNMNSQESSTKNNLQMTQANVPLISTTITTINDHPVSPATAESNTKSSAALPDSLELESKRKKMGESIMEADNWESWTVDDLLDESHLFYTVNNGFVSVALQDDLFDGSN